MPAWTWRWHPVHGVTVFRDGRAVAGPTTDWTVIQTALARTPETELVLYDVAWALGQSDALRPLREKGSWR